MRRKIGIQGRWSIGHKKTCRSTHLYSLTPILHPRLRRGLTLIEVMLAVVILGIGAGVLLLATARCLAVVTKSQRYSTAQRLILQIGAEHPLTRSADIEKGTDSGRFTGEEGYRWEREITEPDEKNRKGLYLVRTRVSWSDRGRDSFEEVTTLLFIKPEEEN